MKPFYWFTRLAAESAAKAFLSLEVVGQEKAITSGGAVIASNHASFLDPPIIATAFNSEIHFLARNTLFKGLFGSLIRELNAVPVDRDQADLKSIKTIIKTLRQGNRVLIFPEGTRTETGDLLEAKAGVGMLIAKSGVPVQPVRIMGSYEALPKGRGLKTHPVKVIVGDPIVFSKEELKVKSREGYQHIADTVMKAIAELG